MYRSTVRCLSVLVLVSLLPAPTLAAKKIKAKACTVVPQGTPWEQALKGIIKHVRKDTAGRVKVKVYWGGAKGSEQECLAKVKANKLQMLGLTVSGVNSEIPAFEVLDLPFLWDSVAEADYVLDKYLTGPATKLLRDKGFVFYQWNENGWHGIGTKGKFIKSPADAAGLKMRVQPSIVHPLTWNAMGSEPVALSPNDTADALASGKANAFSQTPIYTFAANWQMHITHYTISNHIYQPGFIGYSTKFFDALEPDIQKALLANVAEDQAFGRKAVRKLGPQLLENLDSFGIKMYTLTAAEKKQFSAKAKEIRKAFEAKSATPEVRMFLDAIDVGKKAFKKK
jgi:TRAP-type C4-dicarboxylate transport system substrate-binding protein